MTYKGTIQETHFVFEIKARCYPERMGVSGKFVRGFFVVGDSVPNIII